MVIAGSSAGAHLAAQMALTPNDPALQPGFEHADTSISAAICLYGHYGPYFGLDGTERPSSSPLQHDVSQAPPFFIAHGDHDTQLPATAAQAFAHKLGTSSPAPVIYVELPGAQHGFDLVRSSRSDAVLAGIETFLSRAVTSPSRIEP